MDNLLRSIYYDPETGLQGVASVYQKAKEQDPKVTMKLVTEWLKKQETAQVHAPRKEVKHYFPIKSNGKDHIWQADLADFSAQAHNNGGVNYLLCVVDIWTRYAWVRPLKKKESKSVNAAFADILSEGRTPQILMSDNGSEFISRSFQKLREEHNIKASYAEPGDHHRMGLIERFNKTIRGAITKYQTAYKTKKWIDVLPKLVKNYNSTVHSSTGSTPGRPDDKKIEARIKDKEDRARGELTTFQVGDEVRSLKNKVMFEKGAMPKWSAEIRKVTSFIAGKRYMLDNDKSYLYYQLKRVGDAQSAPPAPDSVQQGTPKKERLALKKEGVEKANVREGLRERVPQARVVTRYGEQINW
jgi:transposase InsO family protein